MSHHIVAQTLNDPLHWISLLFFRGCSLLRTTTVHTLYEMSVSLYSDMRKSITDPVVWVPNPTVKSFYFFLHAPKVGIAAVHNENCKSWFCMVFYKQLTSLLGVAFDYRLFPPIIALH